MSEDQVVKIVHTPAHEGVGIKIHRSVQGTSLEVDIHRARQEGESYSEAVLDAVRLMALAYREAEEVAGRMGVTIGRDGNGRSVGAGEARRQIE